MAVVRRTASLTRGRLQGRDVRTTCPATIGATRRKIARGTRRRCARCRIAVLNAFEYIGYERPREGAPVPGRDPTSTVSKVSLVSDRIVFACSCEKTMPLDATRSRRGCGGTPEDGRPALRPRARPLPRSARQRACRSPSPAPCRRRSSTRSRRNSAPRTASPTPRSARPRAGRREATRGRPEDGGAARGLPPSRCPMPPRSRSRAAGVALIYGRDEAAIEAGRRLAEHLDVTVLLTRPGRGRAAAAQRLSRC